MKSDIELIEYFNEKGWSLPKQLQLMVASYGLGYHDGSSELDV